MLLVPPDAIEIAKDMNDPRIRVRVSGRFKCFFSKEKGGPPIGKPWWTKNGAATVGLNYLLNSGFRGATQLTTWYIGRISRSGSIAVRQPA